MICRLCLKDVQCIVNIFDELGEQLNVKEIVSKFFWFEPKPDDPISKAICESCWHKTQEFHEFYTMIEEAHRLLTERFSLDLNTQRPKPATTAAIIPKAANDVSAITALKQDSGHALLKFQITNDHTEDEIRFSDIALNNQDPTTELEEVTCNNDATVSTIHSNNFEDHDEISTYLILNEISELDQDALDEATILYASDHGKRMTRATSKGQNLLSTAFNDSQRQTTKPLNATNQKCRGRPKKYVPITSSPSAKSSSSAKTNQTNKEVEQNKHSYKDKIREGNERIAQFLDLSCDFCSEKCESFASLCKHISLKHGQRGFVICCNKKFYKRVALLDHVERHLNPESYSCKECDKTFADKQCLKNHINIKHLPEESKTFACEVCNKKFGKIYLLELHQRTHKERNHICEACEKGFPSLNQLKAHIKVIHNNYGTMCEICSKVIRGRAAFTRHMLQHEGVDLPKVQCPKCGSWHKDKYSLQKHIKRHNIDGVEHVCNDCGKVAPNRSALLSHKRFVHKERCYKCSQCKKAFKILISLKEHMATHTGQALYKCPYCSRTFNSNANMHSHRKKMHPKEFAEARLHRQKNASLQNSEINEEENKDASEAEEHAA